jgi:TPR repeat protein
MRTTLIAALVCIANLLLPRSHAQYAEAAEKQLAFLRAQAEKGDAQAQSQLADAYFAGRFGLATNVAEAVNWLRKAAAQNVAAAQYNLGACYANGLGVTNDQVEAVRWIRKAAEQNHAAAQSNLGVCYHMGQGVEKDLTEAVKLYQKAAEQDFAGAQYNLAHLYMDGEGVEKNEAEAVKWFRKAADQGDPNAQFKLAVCLAFGRGVPQDSVAAYVWAGLAAGSVEPAPRLREQLAKEMTPEQITAAYWRTKELRANIEAKLKISGSKYIPSESILMKPDLKE